MKTTILIPSLLTNRRHRHHTPAHAIETGSRRNGEGAEVKIRSLEDGGKWTGSVFMASGAGQGASDRQGNFTVGSNWIG